MRIDKNDLFLRSRTVAVPDNEAVTTSNGSEADKEAQLPTNPEFCLLQGQTLRNKIEAVKAIQDELGIQSQAAMPIDPFSPQIIAAVIGWLTSAFGYDAIKFLNENIIDPLGPDHQDLFAPQTAIRQKAIEKLRQADIQDPPKVIKSTEKLLRIFLVKTQDYPEDKLADAKPVARALVSILEGLYQIDDSTLEKKIWLDSTTEHGWQEHGSFLSGTSRVTGTISMFTNPLKWGKGWTKRLEYFTEEADLTQERGWYEHNDVSNLIATLLENCHLNKFPVIDEGAKESLRRILVRNWKVPIVVSNYASTTIQGSKIPMTSRSEAYRLGIYQTMLKTLKQNNVLTTEDPLFLRTPLFQVPLDLRTKASDFRTTLLCAYGNEVAQEEVDPAQYSQAVVKTIESVLDLATEIPRWQWNENAKKQREIELKNEERFNDFKKWGGVVPKSESGEKYTEVELRGIFEKLNQPQKESLPDLQTFFKKDRFASVADLNSELRDILIIMSLSSQEEGLKLTQENTQKGLYFFRFLNSLMEKNIVIAGGSPSIFKNHLNDPNKGYLLSVCKLIVNNRINFDATARDFEFYTNPLLTSVPGQALALHHRLSRCFTSGGYVDIYELRGFVLKNAVSNLSPSGRQDERLTGGFLLSGPQGTGKSSFAEALANQMAVSLVILNKDMINVSDSGIIVTTQDKREITLGTFFHEIKVNAPCVLLLDEVEKVLVPRSVDPGHVKEATPQEESLTSSFLPNLQNLRDERGASKVILMMTSNYPPTENVDIAKINDDGCSAQAEEELYKHVSSTAIRNQRVDYKIFSFHSLYDDRQGEALAVHFLEPYVQSGKVEKPDNYFFIGQVVKDYTPATVESVFSEVVANTSGQVSVQDLLAKLKTKVSRIKMRENTELVERLRSKITSLVRVDQVKCLQGDLDYSSLAIAASGLQPLQIKKALEDYTPETLTQENILAAFERIKNEQT